MNVIRVMVVLLTAWNVAERYANGVQPPDEDAAIVEEPVNLRHRLMSLEGGVVATPTVPIDEWLQKMLRNSKRSNDFNEMTPKSFAWTPESTRYYYLEENQFRVPPRPTVVNNVLEDMLRLDRERKNKDDDEQTALVADELDHLTSGIDITDRPRHTFLYETDNDDLVDSFYGIGILIGVISAVTFSLFGLTYGLYILSKKIKATGEPEYPAYGVTGPSDPQGDSRLAHSAHLYHYQHQKQQIIAMEMGGVPENRDGSVSEPESEEENEEGDYTVYECPGFATTGDMEVKNPMFSDDPTPATPGKCQIVRPQPQE